MSETTVDELKNQVSLIAKLRTEEAQAAQVKKEITAKLETEELKLIGMLEASDLTQFRTDDGLAYISYRVMVKVPKGDEARRAFFDQLKEEGTYDNMITVNSMTLNSWYKSKLEEDPNFVAKGLEPPETTATINFRRA